MGDMAVIGFLTAWAMLGVFAAGVLTGILGSRAWQSAVKIDRDLHEQDAHAKADAAWQLSRRVNHSEAARRYLARLPQPRRVKILSRYCRLIKHHETAA